jgi:hypothetical protein
MRESIFMSKVLFNVYCVSSFRMMFRANSMFVLIATSISMEFIDYMNVS